MAKSSNLTRTDLDSSFESQLSVSSRTSNRSLRVAEKERRKNQTGDPFVLALKYFSGVKAGTPCTGNDVLKRNLVLVEIVGLSRGLPPEAISVMLDYAMSLRMGGVTCVRVLKFLIPATVVPQEAVVRAVSWLCVGKIAISTQVLFLRWVLTVFDMIDSKDHLRAIYGFIFSFVTEENLSPYICHLLYLLTRRESVQPFRVRKLLDLQTKMGRQPFLLHLLSLYKVFCPELVTLALPSRMRSGFKIHNSTWKVALCAVQKRNNGQVSSGIGLSLGLKDETNSRKRKFHHLELPSLSSSIQSNSSSSRSRKVFSLEQLHSFPQLLDNLHCIELPSQMGSLLGSSLALCYLDYVQDDSAFLRLNFWLGHALHEEFLYCRRDGSSGSSSEALHFLNRLLSTQHFLQEGFSSTEGFLYKFLNVWDGSLLRPQILGLLSDIPVVPSSCISQLLFEPLMQLFFTSTLFFKCSVIDCLNNMLLKWLIWHSVYALEDGLDISLNSHTPMNMTLSGFMDSVMELVRFVGRLATVGLQLEGCHSLLLSFILDFYETVCDMFLKYGLPLVVMPPAGVFYPALFATDPVSVDRLSYIMYRYKKNLTSAKCQQQETKQAFHISRQTCQEFNHYLLFMVSCLWNSKMFLPGMAIEVDQELLVLSKVPEPWTSFDLNHHPAFLGCALDFHHKAAKQWNWYMEFLFSQGFQGLQQFAQSSLKRRSAAGISGQRGSQPTSR
ncbi:centromere protein I isoform X3 [Oncorhynchus nerka]|uniref:centromere protein I isoform X3 n=1 Tax=Oncorhynchus nerka TaxID=8023 RepID=UPI0011321B7F|nr:centromere protein I-like isoform X3 [Oncorhynchus nerka]